MKIKPGIQFRLSLLGVLPAGLMGFALAAYFVQVRIADLDRSLDIRGEVIIRELAAASVSALALDDRLVLQDLADAALQEDDVVEVCVFDRQGEVLVERKNLPMPVDVVVSGRWAETIPVLSKRLPDGTHSSLPETLGSVRVALSRSSTVKRQSDTVLLALAMLLGGLAATALLALRMARKISGPVMALTVAVHELSKGNMDARVESEAEAELAYLQAGFNAMAADLKKSRDSLERQIQQATVRLQEALGSLEKRNKELESARWLAEAQTELKSRFLAQMSHEIRTPMNGIIGFAELLAKTPLTEDQAEKLGLITRSAKNLLSIINEILDLSKLEAGKISLNVQNFALRPCLEDIVALLSVKVRQPAIVLWVDACVPQFIKGDSVRIQQVIANLLGNALKFTRRGKIVIRVRALGRSGRGRLLFSVSDSGGGISAQDMAKLFSPFLQLGESVITAEKGAGLGLSISKNIVESMGGKIHLASRLGKGTSLWFELPLLEGAVQEESPTLRMSVGLVETDRVFRLALAGQLQSLGLAVDAFASVDEFFAYFNTAALPQIVIYGFWPSREKADEALPRWLEWCEARQVKPVLVFPCGERRLVSFYRKRGAVCLFHPLRGESLLKTLTELTQAGGADPPKSADDQSLLRTSDCRGLKFLFADDNQINRLLLREQLTKFGAEIVEACDGKAALEQSLQQRFDLIFLDLQMPVMDGFKVLRELRRHPGHSQDVPVIAVTAFFAPGQREAIIQAGFADCLVKPILEEQLSSQMEFWLGSGTSQTEEDGGPFADAVGYASALIERAGGNRGLANVVARKLVTELPESLRIAELALDGRDREAARQAVHKINGSASFSGLTGIRQAAMDLEYALLQGDDWEVIGCLCQELAQEIAGFQSVQGAVLDYVAGTGPVLVKR